MKKFLFVFALIFSTWSLAEINPGGVGSPASFPSGFAGVTDGSSAGAGEVGEVISASISADFLTPSTAVDVWNDVTGLSVTLSAGHWLIVCDDLSGRWDSGTVAGNLHGAVLGLRTSGNTVVDSANSINLMTATNDTFNAGLVTQVNIASSETYKISLLSHSFGGAADSGNKVLRVYGDKGISGSTVLRAIRLR